MKQDDPRRKFNLVAFADMEKNLKSTVVHSKGKYKEAFNEIKETKDDQLSPLINIPENLRPSKLPLHLLSETYHSKSESLTPPKSSKSNFRSADDLNVMGIGLHSHFDMPDSTGPSTRNLDDQYLLSPSNTIVASNGEVYRVEPYMLPPPHEISAMMKEYAAFRENTEKRDGSDSFVNASGFMGPRNSNKGDTKSLESLVSRDQSKPRKYDPFDELLKQCKIYHPSTINASLRTTPSPVLETDDYHRHKEAVGIDKSQSKFSGLREVNTAEVMSSTSDILETPVNVAVKSDDTDRTRDDTAIKRMTLGRILNSPFNGHELSTKTLPRRPPQSKEKYFLSPSNTIVASNGEVYHVEPYMLPPPHLISAMMKELAESKEKRDRPDVIQHQDSFHKSLTARETKSNEKSPQSVLKRHGTEANLFFTSDDGNGSKQTGLRHRYSSMKDVTDTKNYTTEKSPLAESQFIALKESKTQSNPLGGDDEMFKYHKFSLRKYISDELFGVGEPCQADYEAVKKIENFLNVPFNVEKFIDFGFFVCLDSFLYVMTFLPVKVIVALVYLMWEVASYIVRSYLSITTYVEKPWLNMFRIRLFHRHHLYDLIRATHFLIGVAVLYCINMSRLYHYIRGQNMIKLYVLTGMLEVFDKLLGSFGQDSSDSLYTQARSNPYGWEFFISYVAVTVSVIIHSLIYFIHISTLTVAINSSQQQLLTVLILNNFAEIKSFVFKKFDRLSLFQLACKDVTERFQLSLFFWLITMVAMSQSYPAWYEVLPYHGLVLFFMLLAEMIADWVKHAFVAKFNNLEARVYEDMANVLRKDILMCVTSRHEKNILDRTFIITRRVGLAQIPLACVSVRYLSLCLDSNFSRAYFEDAETSSLMLKLVVGFIILLMFQTLISVGVIFYSGYIHNNELTRKKSNPSMETAALKQEKKELIEQLSNIDRYTVYRGKIIG